MSNIYAQTLREILTQHGRNVCSQPERVRALLRDYLGKQPGNHEQPVNVLVLALQQRAAVELLEAQGQPAELVKNRLAARLRTTLGLTEGVANWAAATWAAVLLPQTSAPKPGAPAAAAAKAPPAAAKPPARSGVQPPTKVPVPAPVPQPSAAIQTAPSVPQPMPTTTNGLSQQVASMTERLRTAVPVPAALNKLPGNPLLWMGAGAGLALMFLLCGGVGLVMMMWPSGGASGDKVTATDATSEKTTVKDKEKPVPPAIFAAIRDGIRENRHKFTRQGFGGFGEQPFQELPVDGALLIGFEVGMGMFVAEGDMIGYLRPIFVTAGGEKLGIAHGRRPAQVRTIKAKNGYLVAGVRVESLGIIEGLAVTFMKLDERGQLNPGDAYQSEWIGGARRGRGENGLVGGDGSLVIGITGKIDDDHLGAPTDLGLVLLRIPLLGN